MAEQKEITKKLSGTFQYCTECDYKGSFHIFPEKLSDAKSDNVKMRLKCPNCSQVYDLGLYMTAK